MTRPRDEYFNFTTSTPLQPLEYASRLMRRGRLDALLNPAEAEETCGQSILLTAFHLAPLSSALVLYRDADSPQKLRRIETLQSVCFYLLFAFECAIIEKLADVCRSVVPRLCNI